MTACDLVKRNDNHSEGGCVDLLANVCPNCGGGFTVRPVRQARNGKNGNDLTPYPAPTTIRGFHSGSHS
ncbi:DUF1272 domain-containing protein [bacterium]|nr:DUF1272 domain-containing protein [bacterium]